jgi:general secretion pathway protein G
MTILKGRIMKLSKKHKVQNGFTLVELMVVIVIIGILAGGVGLKLLGNLEKAKAGATKAQVMVFHNAVKMFKIDTNFFPDSLNELVEDPGDLDGWQEDGYLDGVIEIPLDGWGFEYEYEIEGSRYYIWSLGADGEDGGEGYNADIYNIQLSRE